MKEIREGLKGYLCKLPPWLFSIVTFLAILWLTLAPQPLGEEPPQLFPGADKIVHGLMFGFFAAMMCLDRERRHQWKQISKRRIFVYATLSAIAGILIEFAQASMGMGRSFEIQDIVADSVGAYLAGILWVGFQRFWSENIF